MVEDGGQLSFVKIPEDIVPVHSTSCRAVLCAEVGEFPKAPPDRSGEAIAALVVIDRENDRAASLHPSYRLSQKVRLPFVKRPGDAHVPACGRATEGEMA